MRVTVSSGARGTLGQLVRWSDLDAILAFDAFSPCSSTRWRSQGKGTDAARGRDFPWPCGPSATLVVTVRFCLRGLTGRSPGSELIEVLLANPGQQRVDPSGELTGVVPGAHVDPLGADPLTHRLECPCATAGRRDIHAFSSDTWPCGAERVSRKVNYVCSAEQRCRESLQSA